MCENHRFSMVFYIEECNLELNTLNYNKVIVANIQKGKQILYGLWVLVILFFIYQYIKDPSIINPNTIVEFISFYENEMLLVYTILCLVRGFFLIPSTPFVVGGGLLFPDHKLMVLIISMIGVMSSATMLYYFSDLLGFSKYLESKSPKQILKWKNRLQKPGAIYFVTAWSFFPLVPTDLICYIGGIIKMPFKFIFFGVFVGELILNIFYVYWSDIILDGFIF